MRDATIITVVNRVKARLEKNTNIVDSLALAMAASTSDEIDGMKDSLLCILTSKPPELSNDDFYDMSVSNSEWDSMIEGVINVTPTNEQLLAINQIFSEDVFKQFDEDITKSLCFSLDENNAAIRWRMPFTKLALFVAIFHDDAEEKMGRCIGGIVRGDRRRLDEMRAYFEAGGNENELLLAKAIMAMCKLISSAK